MLTGREKSRAAWRHNALFGSVRMSIQHMNSVMNCATTSDTARMHANHIQRLLFELIEDLKERNYDV